MMPATTRISGWALPIVVAARRRASITGLESSFAVINLLSYHSQASVGILPRQRQQARALAGPDTPHWPPLQSFQVSALTAHICAVCASVMATEASRFT